MKKRKSFNRRIYWFDAQTIILVFVGCNGRQVLGSLGPLWKPFGQNSSTQLALQM